MQSLAASAPLGTPSSSAGQPTSTRMPLSWDSALATFLSKAGLAQTLRGFEADMLVMNPDFERSELPGALKELSEMLQQCAENASTGMTVPPLDERKLRYVRTAKDVEAQTPGMVNKSISQLLSRKRARNDASNRAEFLIDKSARADGAESSTARVDAKVIDRDAMMKFDIAKNDDGPLRRTMEAATDMEDKKAQPAPVQSLDEWANGRHPGLDERLKNLEEHLALRYVPAMPVSLLVRLQLVEDHIVSLEREYPPWAALHFNQPRRGWPPPPRSTPVIVSSHLTSTAAQNESAVSTHADDPTALSGEHASPAEAKGKGRVQSSLQRAVLERLQVQQALTDLKGAPK